MMFASCAEHHLRHGQAHQLGVGEPLGPPGPSPLRFDDMVVDDHIQFGEEGIEVRRHKRPSMPSSHTNHKQTRRACNQQGERRADPSTSTHSAGSWESLIQ
jgi:hypothetical protein